MPDTPPAPTGSRGLGEWLVLPVGAVGCLGLLAYAFTATAACFALLEDRWNWHWIPAVIVVGLCIYAVPPLLVVGAFFGAWLVWEWPFLGALAFAMPGLVFALAILLVGGIASVFRTFAGRR